MQLVGHYESAVPMFKTTKFHTEASVRRISDWSGPNPEMYLAGPDSSLLVGAYELSLGQVLG